METQPTAENLADAYLIYKRVFLKSVPGSQTALDAFRGLTGILDVASKNGKVVQMVALIEKGEAS